MTKTRMASYHF